MQLALEDRHRAVTLVHLSCSGADVVNGLFVGLEAREHYDPAAGKSKTVPPQFDQLTRLLCRTEARSAETYVLPTYEAGSTRVADRPFRMEWCPAAQRKRDVDLLLLSIGGNDVGFSALAAYAFLESAGDIASVVKLRESKLRFGPAVADVYLSLFDVRIDAVKRALAQGFGVAPSTVVQTSYEALQYDENNKFCGAEFGSGRLGMDVHSKLRSSLRASRRSEISTTAFSSGWNASARARGAARRICAPASARVSRSSPNISRPFCAAEFARATPATTGPKCRCRASP